MTIDRDDPKGRRRSAPSDDVEAVSPSAADVALCRTVRGTVGAVLLSEGLSPETIDAILEVTEREFRAFRKSITDPSHFLVKRILANRDKYLKNRGTEGAEDAEEQAPPLLVVVRTQAALDTLSRHARIAMLILYHRGGTFADVAEALGVSDAYVPRLVDKTLDILSKWRPARGTRE